MKVSFHLGFRLARTVLVFCLVEFLGSGMSLSLTYGSDAPLGSIGIRFMPSITDVEIKKRGNHEFIYRDTHLKHRICTMTSFDIALYLYKTSEAYSKQKG